MFKDYILRLFIEYGIDLNLYGSDGNTVLKCYVENNLTICVRYMLSKGADMYYLNVNGYKIWDSGISKSIGDIFETDKKENFIIF